MLVELTQAQLEEISERLDPCPRCGEPMVVSMYGWELNYRLQAICHCTIEFEVHDYEALIEAANRRTKEKP